MLFPTFYSFQHKIRDTREVVTKRKIEKGRNDLVVMYDSNQRSWKNRWFICTQVARIVIVKCEQRLNVPSYKSCAPFAVKNHMAVGGQMFTGLCVCIRCQFRGAWNRFHNGLTHFNLSRLYYSYYKSLLQSPRTKMTSVYYVTAVTRHTFHFSSPIQTLYFSINDIFYYICPQKAAAVSYHKIHCE